MAPEAGSSQCPAHALHTTPERTMETAHAVETKMRQGTTLRNQRGPCAKPMEEPEFISIKLLIEIGAHRCQFGAELPACDQA